MFPSNWGARKHSVKHVDVRRYYRIQKELVGVSDAMDDVRAENVRDLKLFAQTMIDGEGDKLSQLYERLERVA
jgi:hypothetical protein